MACLLQFRRRIAAFAMLAAATSLAPARANFFGPDDRAPVLSREYPWRRLGVIVARFETGLATGAGFPIGRDLVLINAHITVDETTGRGAASIYFLPNRVDGVASNAVHGNRVWRGTGEPQREPERDWAVLRLDSNLGDDLGWLELAPLEVDRGYIAGYSDDLRAQDTAAVAPLTFRDGLRGDVRPARGRDVEARQDYRDALALDGDCLDFTLVRAAYCLASGEYDEAVAIASRVIAGVGDHKLAYQMRAAAYQQLGEMPLAQADIRQRAAL